MDDIIAEWGSITPIRFPDPSSVKMYDSEGKEIEIPKCEKCGLHKSPLIGKESFMWICMMGCENGS